MEDKNTIEVSSWDEVEKNATPVTSFEETETVKKKRTYYTRFCNSCIAGFRAFIGEWRKG